MAYNIGDVSGNSVGGGSNGVDTWTFTGDLNDSGLTVITGDFGEMSLAGADLGTEAAGGYSAGPLSTTAYGSLSFNTTDGTFTFSINRSAVFQSLADQTVSFTVSGTNGSGTVDTDTVFINLLICLARGTLVETPYGAQRIERLRVGDLVSTLDDGPQPVRWIGSRKVRRAELVADPILRPIRIRAGALGDNMPWRDLRVSPQHRVLQSGWQAQLFYGEDEVLAPARSLVDGKTIHVDEDATEVEYFHLLFDRHQVILSEGAPTESFLPGPWTLGFLSDQARNSLLALFPDLAADASAYGPPARRIVRHREGAVLSAPAPSASPRKAA